LQRGRSAAPESEDVKPVPAEHIDATLAWMPSPVAAMVQVQRLTACRAGEVMAMRGIDLERSGEVWWYRPGSDRGPDGQHKPAHRGRQRVIAIGPRAQEVLRPFLGSDPQAYLFSPRAYVEELHTRRAGQRKTRRTPSELRRGRKAAPQLRQE